MSLETYITLQEASQQYNLDLQQLTHAVNDGRIRGGRFNGTFVLLERDAKRMAKQQATREELRAKVAHLEGKSIGVREAARKYNRRRAAATQGESAIPLDDETRRCIRLAGYELDHILPAEKKYTFAKPPTFIPAGLSKMSRR